MRILGVDPGSQATGWGYIEQQGARCCLLDCGVIRLPRGGAGLAGRLARLQREIATLVDRLEPACAAVESPFHGVNARSALQLAHARGVVLAGLAAAGVDVVEYTPAAIKRAVTGSGRADKRQVQVMVSHLIRPATLPGPSHDLSDAIAVALCHGACSRMLARIGDR